MRRLAALAIALALSGLAWGQASEIANPDAATEQRLKALAEELRCLVCQNQTIADSHAPLALDLRNQIRTQISQGRSDDEIRGYMVERYGDFVLYKPPLKASTVLLWYGPFFLLVLGAFFLTKRIKDRRARQRQPELTEAERARAAELLGPAKE